MLIKKYYFRDITEKVSDFYKNPRNMYKIHKVSPFEFWRLKRHNLSQNSGFKVMEGFLSCVIKKTGLWPNFISDHDNENSFMAIVRNWWNVLTSKFKKLAS